MISGLQTGAGPFPESLWRQAADVVKCVDNRLFAWLARSREMSIVQDPTVLRGTLLRDQLRADLAGFEQMYGIDSDTFYRQYEEGKLGDAVDFVEWSSTVEMLNNINEQLKQ